MNRLVLNCLYLAVTLPACQKSAPSTPAPASASHPVDAQPILAQHGSAVVIGMNMELRDDGLLLHVSNVPAGSTLECDLDGKPLMPCHDGALFGRPAAGNHKLTALAMRGGSIAALGESAPFAVASGAAGDDGSALSLSLDDQQFSNGMTVPMDKDLRIKFKLNSPAPCAAVQLRCRYGNFWTQCDPSNTTETIGKDLLALGEQELYIQASCAAQLGPILRLNWYGVPANYQNLQLAWSKDMTGRYLVTLVRAQDCASEQMLECAAANQADFSDCAYRVNNVFNQPPSGYQVRARCGAVSGPVLTFGS